MRKIFMFFLFWLLLNSFGCSIESAQSKREIKDTNTKIFFGMYDNTKDSLLFKMIDNLNRAFKLEPIKVSPFSTEIRIYYADAFGERFFRQSFLNGKSEIELYRCKTNREKDSLFLNIQSVIKCNGKLSEEILHIDFKEPTFSTIIFNDTAKAVADNGSYYLIEIKNKDKSKNILIKDPFEIEGRNATARYVCQFIKNINAQLSFKFYNTWDATVDSAFTKICK
jgi:hypothetical protein